MFRNIKTASKKYSEKKFFFNIFAAQNQFFIFGHKNIEKNIFSEYVFQAFVIVLNTVHQVKRMFLDNSGQIGLLEKSSEKKYFLLKFGCKK